MTIRKTTQSEGDLESEDTKTVEAAVHQNEGDEAQAHDSTAAPEVPVDKPSDSSSD